MKIRFKKLNENAVMPTKAHASDAGFDLTATSRRWRFQRVMWDWSSLAPLMQRKTCCFLIRSV